MLRKLLKPWLRKPQADARATERRFRPRVEELEPRWVPADYSVTNTNDMGMGSLRQAIIDLNNGNEATNTITFGDNARGTITLASALDPIRRPVDIQGPGSDALTVTRDPAQGDFRIFEIQTTDTVSIRALTISGGSAGAGNNGGGILLGTGTLRVLFCTISNNTAESGGGIAVSQGTLEVRNSSITGNSADTQGGGLYAGASAGAVSILGGATSQAACYVTDNKAGSAGGGIYFENPATSIGSLTIDNTNITFNRVVGNGNGGGLFAQASGNRAGSPPVQVNRTLFLGNFIAPGATGGGGAVYNNGIATLANCTIAGNTASYGGGLMHARVAANLTRLLNCTITQNTSRDGAGAALQAGGLDGTQGASGLQANGAFGIDGSSGDDGLELGNTIVAGNTAPTYPDVAGHLTSLGHNLIGNGDGADGFLDSDLVGTAEAPIDPSLSDLGDHGGPTQTYVLLAGSPALAAGDVSLVDAATDQRGYDRIVNGAVDIGAVEMQPDELTGL
jgi:hypothetical protein